MLIYELKKMERYLRANLLESGPRLMKKYYRAAVSQRLRNTDVEDLTFRERNVFLCKRAERLPRSKRFSPRYKTSLLISYKAKVTVCSEILMQPINLM